MVGVQRTVIQPHEEQPVTTATPEEARLQIVKLVRDFVKRDVEPVAAKLRHLEIDL